MRNIWGLITYIFSPGGLFKDTLEEAEFIHFKVFSALLAFIPVIFVEFLLNIAGRGLWIIFLAAAISFFIMFVATRPKTLAEVTAIGAALPEGKKATEGIKDISALYFSLIVKVVLWFDLVSIFLATMPIRSFPMALPLVTFALFVLGLMSISWQMEIKYAKKIAYAYVAGAIVVSFALCIPRATYLNWIKFYPFEHIVTSETAKALSAIDETENKIKDDNDADALKKINSKIKGEQVLDSSEKALLEQLRKDRSENAIPNKIANGAGAAVNGVKKIFKGDSTPPPPTLSPEEQFEAAIIAGTKRFGQEPKKVVLSAGGEHTVNMNNGARIYILALDRFKVLGSEGAKWVWGPAVQEPRRNTIKSAYGKSVVSLTFSTIDDSPVEVYYWIV